MKIEYQSDIDIIRFEKGDGFCNNRCSKSKSDIGNCFCAHMKWMKLNSGASSTLLYTAPKQASRKYGLKLSYAPSYVKMKSKCATNPHPVAHGYSQNSEAYYSRIEILKEEHGI